MNRHVLLLLSSLVLLATGCSSSSEGMQCLGEVKTLPGLPIGITSAVIVDNTAAFSVLMPTKQRIESGLLYSADSSRYVPSAVTKEGYLAQRLSGNTFCIINPEKNEYTIYRCQ